MDHVARFELSPGVVIDTDAKVAYVAADPERRTAAVARTQGGAIVAVGLADGRVLWTSNDAAKPLTIAGDVVVGQAEEPGPGNTLKLVTLNARQGQRVVESTIPLPPNVHPMIGQGGNRSFTATAVPQTGQAAVSWEFVERPLRGVTPGPPQVLPGEIRAASVSASEGVPHPAAIAPMAAAARHTSPPTVIRGAAQVDLSSGHAEPTVPHLTAAAPVAPVGQVPPPHEPIPGLPQPQFLSADGQHVMTSQRVAEEPEWNKYLWKIYDRNTGEQVGQFRTHVRYAPFFVTDGRVIYHTQPYSVGREPDKGAQINAVSLTNGSPLWSHPVRDTVDRRPRPP
jgi:hypothetical protein